MNECFGKDFYLRCLESRFAACSDSNRHRFAAISNRMIRIAGPKTFRIAIKVLPFFTFKIGFKSRDSIRWRFKIVRSAIRIARFKRSKISTGKTIH